MAAPVRLGAQVTRYPHLQDLAARVGEVIGESDWLTIEQSRIDAFAHATGDLQWIHIDPVRAAAGPFGKTIAHGFLTLSLLPLLTQQCIRMPSVRMGVNYGLNKVRFPGPVPVGSRLRGRFTVKDVEDIEGGVQLTLLATLEVEGAAKPVCVAETVSRRYE